jgi:hypothetical protein
MKKIYILSTSLLLLILAGCESKEYHEFEDTLVKIESADVVFSAVGGTGEIVVAGAEAFTVASDQDWCTSNNSGRKVLLTVEPNLSMSGRTAKITIRAGEKLSYVMIMQLAAGFKIETTDIHVAPKVGEEMRVPYETDVQLAIGQVVDNWLTASIEDQEIVLRVAVSNPSLEEARTTTVTVAIQNQGETIYTQKLNVTQDKNYLAYEDFLGNYAMSYSISYSNPTATRVIPVTFSEKVAGQSYKLEGILPDEPDFPGEIIATYNEGLITILGQIMYTYPAGTDFTIGTKGNTSAGVVKEGYLYWLLPYSSANYTYRNSTYGVASSNIDLSSGLKFKMLDNGVCTAAEKEQVVGFILRIFNGSTTVSSIYGKKPAAAVNDYRYLHLEFVKQ